MEWQHRLDTGTEEDSIHQLDRVEQVTIFRLRTGHCQLLSYLHRLKISHSDKCPWPQVLKPTTTSCSPAPPSTLWDTRHGPVWWMPTGSFGNQLRPCGRQRTSPYSPDWKSSMARNAEEGDVVYFLRYLVSIQHMSVAKGLNYFVTLKYKLPLRHVISAREKESNECYSVFYNRWMPLETHKHSNKQKKAKQVTTTLPFPLPLGTPAVTNQRSRWPWAKTLARLGLHMNFNYGTWNSVPELLLRLKIKRFYWASQCFGFESLV